MSRVLVVEDSPTQAEALRLILEEAGFEVELAPEGGRALERLVSQRFDLAVTDILMPGMNGYELCRAAKSDPRSSAVPFVLVTSLSDPEDVVQGLACGADGFVSKPYEPSLLVARIQGILENRRMRDGNGDDAGVDALFLGRKLRVTSDRQQILGLLLTTFEDIVRTHRRLLASQAELGAANAKVEAYAQQLEGRVRSSEEHFRRLVECMDDIVYTLDRQQRHTGVFGRWLAREGARPEDYLGRTVQEMFGPEAAEPHVQANLRALSGEAVVYEWNRGGRHFQTSLSPLFGPGGEVQGVVGVGRELTEEKKLQAQLMISDRMASVGTLAAGVAHEINNPLASVVANLELATHEMEALSGPRSSHATLRAEMEAALEGAEKVRQIVRDLKIYSRSEEQQGPVDVQRVLESSLRMAWNEVRHRAQVVKSYAEVPPVQGNESRLGQVFLNLLVNAAQALPAGLADQNQIRLSIRSEGAMVVVEVADTGPGIPQDVLPRLFTPFFTTKAPGVGTGLGLSICQRLVQGFGGRIRVESEVGKGTVFKVELPAASGVVLERPTPVPAPRAAARRGRVLVVDDERMITEVVRRTLAAEHEVTTKISARAALSLLRSGERFDVILCDLMMPDMTGMELHAQLSQVAPEQAGRIVFLTGGAFTPSARAFLDQIGNRRLEKPFQTAVLRATVNDMLGEKG